MKQTAMSAAFKQAGYNTAEYRLRMLAADAMKKHHNNVERAAVTLRKSIVEDQDALDEALKVYLQFRLQNQNLPETDHRPSDTHGFGVGDRQNGDARGQVVGADLKLSATPSSANGKGQAFGADPFATASPVREPSAAHIAAAAKVARVISKLDTFLIRDGRAIGDVRYGELESLRTTNVMEASVIRQIQRHASAPHDTKVRDVVSADELNRFIQRAAEVADAA